MSKYYKVKAVRPYWSYSNPLEFKENQPWLYLATLEHEGTSREHILRYHYDAQDICGRYLLSRGYSLITPKGETIGPEYLEKGGEGK